MKLLSRTAVKDVLPNSAIPAKSALALIITATSLWGCGGGGSATPAADQANAPSVQIQLDDASGSQNWSDPATWGGTLPQAGATVTIPAGKNVVLDTNVNIGTLTIEGSLTCAHKDLNFSARWVMVHGRFICGTEANPYRNQMVMTLKGNNPAEDVMGMGTKTLSAMQGGFIAMHGENRTSWLMLNKTANAGHNQITVEYAPNWRKGDSIVISSTDDDMHHAEVRKIRKIEGKNITLDAPLQHRHFGQSQSYSNGSQTWQLDTRAEVALLTRNIRIQGDNQSTQNGFGGHIMIMKNAVALFSGVELYRLGQKGILARYPFHWHMADNVAGQYFKNSSIRNSFNRCVTVHGSHNALVEDNVCYDHIGHGYFLEDGVETGNRFHHNLGLLTRKPEAHLAIIPSDILEGEAARGPATFWISNGNNTFTQNAAAGSDGLGFWYDTKNAPMGASAGMSKYRNVKPVNSEFGVFNNNRVHSSDMAFSSCSEGSGPIGYKPPTQANYINLTVFAGGDGAVWPCHGDQRFTNLIVSDTGHKNHAGFVAPRPVTVQNSLFVANSRLSDGGRGRQRSAIGIYDFGVNLRGIHFEGFNLEYGGSYVFGARGADVRFTNNPASGLTFGDSYLYYDRRKPVDEMTPSRWGALIHDEDGSFGLGPNSALVADHPLMTDSTCTDNYGQGKLCMNRYGRVEIDFNSGNLPPLVHYRSDGREMTAKPHVKRKHYQSVVSVNHNRYHYSYKLDSSLLARRSVKISLQFLHNNDTAVLEFRDMPSSATVSARGYSVATSLEALKSSAGKQVFYSGNSVFVKMRATGTKWNATDTLTLKW